MSSSGLKFVRQTALLASVSTNDSECVGGKTGPEIFQSLKNSKEPGEFYRKLSNPRLSGKPGDLIDFSDDETSSIATNRTSFNARELLNLAKLKNCTPTVGSSKPDASNPLTNFKHEMEKKMKLQRDEGMNKREELYRKEMKDFNENFGGVNDVDDEDDEEEGSEICSNVTEVHEAPETVDVPDEEVDENAEDESVSESLDTQNLHLVLYEDSERIPSGVDEVVKDAKNFNDSNTLEMNRSSIEPYQRQRKSSDTTVISNGSQMFPFQTADADELGERLNVSNKFLSSSPSSVYRFPNDDDFNTVSTPKVDGVRINETFRNLFDPDDDKDSFSTQNLLDLCSGQFAAVPKEREEKQSVVDDDRRTADENKEHDDVAGGDDVGNENEHGGDGVCEENFLVIKRRTLFVDEEDDDVIVESRRNVVIDDDEEDDTVDEKEQIDVSDEEDVDVDDDQDDDGVDEEDDEVAMFRKMDAHKFLGVKGQIRKEFIENEAELSGSEIGSDDDEDGSIDDFLEAEEGDLDQDLPDDDELRDQVGKIHNKQMLDDDKRRLLLYKEAYLPDGDLHSDTDLVGRRLRWRTNDDADANFALDDDKNDEDDVAHCSNVVDDQRVMFLFDQKEKVDDFNEANFESFFPSLKSEKITIRRSISSSTTSSASQQFDKEKTFGAVDNVFSETFDSTSRRDSFLSRSSMFLKKIVKENGDSNSLAAANISKCLFTTVRSPDAPVEKNKRKLPTANSNSVSVSKKRAKLPIEGSTSIFEYL